MAQPVEPAAALAAFRRAVGEACVDVEQNRLLVANRSTLAAEHRLVAILQPGSTLEVRRIMKLAAEFGVPLHPVSTGKNWGYGSRLPYGGPAALLSLAALAAIESYDEPTGTVTVGPGVTFAALARFLADQGGRFAAPSTGSTPKGSVIGNMVDRGIGKGLYEDMANHLVAAEVVTADGGLAAVGPMQGALLPGSGPDLRGLFVQGNFGIVVRARLRLELDPPLRQTMTGMLPDLQALAAFFEASRAALQVGDPWLRFELVNGARAEVQGSSLRTPGWLVVARLWGKGKDDLALRVRTVANLFGRFCKATSPGLPDDAPPSLPDDEGLRSAYSAKGCVMPEDPDPDRDRCGVIWITANLRHEGLAVAHAASAFEQIMAGHGFAPAISLRVLDGRSLRIVAGLFGDRDRTGDDARAAACGGALHAFLHSNGISAGRLTVADAFPGIPEADGGLARAVKRAVDPAAILAPGRYIPDPVAIATRSAGRSSFAHVDFTRASDDPALDQLGREMAADIAGVVGSMPDPLARDAAAVLAAYARGHPHFMGLYYRPSWSFLARVPLLSENADVLPALRRLHAMTLFLHLWDDHLSDGQLSANPARLHLRTRAWVAMEAEAASLAARAGLDDRCWRQAEETYLVSVQEPGYLPNLEACLALARREAALPCIAPALHAHFAGVDPQALTSIIENFAVAWRIVDDIQDIDRDAATGRRSAVRLTLSDAGGAAWDRYAGSVAGGGPDTSSWATLTPHLAAAIPILTSRANREIHRAAATARLCGWSSLQNDLLGSRV
jgi:4-cresol dehydrogenase (hydroxylating)